MWINNMIYVFFPSNINYARAVFSVEFQTKCCRVDRLSYWSKLKVGWVWEVVIKEKTGISVPITSENRAFYSKIEHSSTNFSQNFVQFPSKPQHVPPLFFGNFPRRYFQKVFGTKISVLNQIEQSIRPSIH